MIAIIPTADRQKATVKVRVGFEKLDPRILPDMGVKVAFQGAGGLTAGNAVVTVPKDAVHERSGQDIVWVARERPGGTAFGHHRGIQRRRYHH